ncbi:MAG: ankyrin repeat domain-containing protein [Flavobacteriaceae bacterium]|jgi:ankyrin repeat protein|nr:ankyrin repeat domain-containing protein [Flavobacteriaceae bacterium]
MKKIFLISLTLVAFILKAQQGNTLLSQDFWKTKPDVAAVQAEIAKGNSPTELNGMAFDATSMAINNDAPNATIKFLLEQKGNSISKLTHDNRIYLHWAASKGNAEIVKYLIDKGSDIRLEDSHGIAPIAFAAGNGQTNVAVYEAFFKAGIDVKSKYRDGASLLLLAIPSDKDLSLTNYFVSKGLSLSDVDNNGNTAFNYAARAGNLELLKTLLKKGVKYTDNALLMAAQGTRRSTSPIEVYQYLVEELKIKPTITGENGDNVLHTIVRRQKQSEIVNYFLAKGVDVNKADNDGNTPLINAASGKEVEIVGLLVSKIKNVNAVNAKGESALTAAVKQGSPDVVSLLLDKGADIKIKDKEGNSLAYYLIQSYRPLRAGAPNNAQQEEDFEAKLKKLQDKSLDFTSLQKDGNTLYHVAITKNDLTLLKKIANLNINVNAKNNEGLTVLHKAAMIAKDTEILKYLLSIGAKKDILTEFDETAYDLAKENEFLTKNNITIDFLK